jgi:hypothetical protein
LKPAAASFEDLGPKTVSRSDTPLVEIEVGKQGNGCGCEIAVARQCGEKFERDQLHRLSPGSSVSGQSADIWISD